jgi:rhamnogalacturonyl hydrolase YesR
LRFSARGSRLGGVPLNHHLLAAGFCLGSAAALGAAPRPCDAPAPAAVLSIMERVGDWQLAHPSKHPAKGWTQAVGDAGFMALAGISPHPRFLEAMRRAGEANDWRLGPRPYEADDYCIGQTYAELYLRYHDPRMIAALRADFDFILAHPKDDNLEFSETENPDYLDRWSWCDSLFMGPPAWVRLYAATGRGAYLDFAVEHWRQTSEFLYDPGERLFFRDSSYFNRREANGRKMFWSRGNGWVMGGLVRVLQYLPSGHPDRSRFESQFRDMAAAVLACQQSDGFWRSSLLDPASYPLRESSGTALYCYALAWGVNQGLLDRAKFEPGVLKAWRGLVSCVTPEGRLTHVQPIGSDPKKFDPNSTEIYGVGAFLLAGSEIYRLGGLP